MKLSPRHVVQSDDARLNMKNDPRRLRRLCRTVFVSVRAMSKRLGEPYPKKLNSEILYTSRRKMREASKTEG